MGMEETDKRLSVFLNAIVGVYPFACRERKRANRIRGVISNRVNVSNMDQRVISRSR